MSKNKNYHNYKNYSSNKPKIETEKVEEVVIPETLEESMTSEPTTETTATPTTGIVSNCQRLRVRAKSTTESEVLCEILINSEVTIDKQNSTKDFYKVTTPAGVEGFCMKKFIVVK